ncbi:hypothetical protein OG625_39035 [Streptomyces sp. NBC_01351]|uniref:hypothetical protein n=1 Tax=Streptomyces sp. NBC_01351 TaxID=2903833 RepID=UPI002E2EB2AE|nr:hypothetical protein [Streptomyces sp. NBC_01351]
MRDRFHITVRFRAGGPAVEGQWEDEAAALRKFRSWVGRRGSTDGVVITLWRETEGARTDMRTWMPRTGETVHRQQ